MSYWDDLEVFGDDIVLGADLPSGFPPSGGLYTRSASSIKSAIDAYPDVMDSSTAFLFLHACNDTLDQAAAMDTELTGTAAEVARLRGVVAQAVALLSSYGGPDPLPATTGQKVKAIAKECVDVWGKNWDRPQQGAIADFMDSIKSAGKWIVVGVVALAAITVTTAVVRR